MLPAAFGWGNQAKLRDSGQSDKERQMNRRSLCYQDQAKARRINAIGFLASRPCLQALAQP